MELKAHARGNGRLAYDIYRVGPDELTWRQRAEMRSVFESVRRHEAFAFWNVDNVFRDAARRYIAVKGRGRVIGFALDNKHDTGMELNVAVVAPRYRKQGIYSHLVDARIRDTIDEGIGKMTFAAINTAVVPAIEKSLQRRVADGSLKSYSMVKAISIMMSHGWGQHYYDIELEFSDATLKRLARGKDQ